MIAKMSRYDIVLYSPQSDDFVDRLRNLGLMDVTTLGWEPSEEDHQLLLDIEGVAKTLDFVKEFFDSDAYRPEAAAFGSGVEAYNSFLVAQQQATALKSDIAQLDKQIEELDGWGEFSAEVIAKLAAKGVDLRFFTAPRDLYLKSVDQWSESLHIELISEDRVKVRFVVVANPGDDIQIDAQQMRTPTMSVSQLERSIAEKTKELQSLDKIFSRVTASEALLQAESVSLRERLQSVQVIASAESDAEGHLLIFEGWADQQTEHEVDRLLDAFPGLYYIKSDPTPEDNTPVKLTNNWFTRIFELVGDMYARPKYGTMDLTPFFAPFYMLFFGICLNDAGYGLILLAMGLGMLCKFKDGMMRRASLFATMCGAMTVVFGLICGSVFGVNLKEYFPQVPFLDFQTKFFSIAIAIGVVQILFGMILKIIMLSYTQGFRYALSSLGWFLVILSSSLAMGLPMLAPDMAIPGFETDSVAYYSVMGLGGVLMFFFNSPGKNIFVNFGVGIWDTYNNITGILSDVLSYIRLFAIGLSGGVLATVFNALAVGFVPEGANIFVKLLVMIPILAIGHGINLFMSTISSFVHPMRLTFVEFYKNAGFEMALRSFKPLEKIENSEN